MLGSDNEWSWNHVLYSLTWVLGANGMSIKVTMSKADLFFDCGIMIFKTKGVSSRRRRREGMQLPYGYSYLEGEMLAVTKKSEGSYQIIMRVSINLVELPNFEKD